MLFMFITASVHSATLTVVVREDPFLCPTYTKMAVIVRFAENSQSSFRTYTYTSLTHLLQFLVCYELPFHDDHEL